MLDAKTRALLGDREAQERLTDAGVHAEKQIAGRRGGLMEHAQGVSVPFFQVAGWSGGSLRGRKGGVRPGGLQGLRRQILRQ